MFHSEMHWGLTLARTLQEVDNDNKRGEKKDDTTGMRNSEKRSQRIHVSAEAQNITHEVKLQVQ